MGKNTWTMKTVNGQSFRSTTEVVGTSDIEGLDELIRDIAAFADEAMPDLIATTDAAAKVILARAKQKAPVGSDPTHAGTLKNSLKIVKARTKKGTYIAMSRVTFGKEAAYAVPVELGHDTRRNARGKGGGPHVQERPFLRPAADESKDTVLDMMIRTMDGLIQEKLGDK